MTLSLKARQPPEWQGCLLSKCSNVWSWRRSKSCCHCTKTTQRPSCTSGPSHRLGPISSWMIQPCGCLCLGMLIGTVGDLTPQNQTLCHCPSEGMGRCILHPILAAGSGHLWGKCCCMEMETVSLFKGKWEHCDGKKSTRTTLTRSYL